MKNYKVEDIMNLISDIEYGYMDKNNNIHYEIDNLFSNNYILESPNEVIKNKIGVCWDQVELERYYFLNTDLNIKTYFMVYYDNDKCPTHTFLQFYKNNKYYWFEHAFTKYIGIHEYANEKELLLDVKSKFIESINDYNDSNLVIYNYEKPNYHITVSEFYKHCESGIKIIL